MVTASKRLQALISNALFSNALSSTALSFKAFSFIAAITCFPQLLWATEGAKTDEPTSRMKSVILTHAIKLDTWVADPTIIAAVKAQNAKNVALDEIQKLDQEWVAGSNIAFANSLQENAISQWLKKKIGGNVIYVEAFLCDNKGAVVGEYPKTSDYWQGDEDKFSQSFNSGDGKLYYGPVMLDQSTDSYSVQVSLPVKDGKDTIGVLVVGLKNVK